MSKYKEYAQKVVNDEVIVGKYVKLGCQRFLDWFNREDIEFREKKVDKVVNFISKLKHFQGKHNGTPFILSDWQVWIVANIFGWYYKNTDKRVIRNVYIEMARKQGKSALLAAISLYCLLADGENGAEIDCVANSRQQARILYDLCEGFASTLDTKQKYVKRFRNQVKFPITKSFLQVLSSDASKLDGFNSSLFVEDELHAAVNSKLYDVLKSSQGMRENPLAICITSAGFDKFGFCYQMRTTCTEILQGIKTDDSQFAAIYSIDEEDDWKDEKCWIKANPNLNVTVTLDYLREQVQQAKNNSALEVSTRTKNLGQWVDSQDIWLSNELLLDSTQKVDLADFKECYIGVDLASVSDFTAVSYMMLKEGKYYFKTNYYLPNSALFENSNKELYKEWKRKGLLTITDGNVCDYDYILTDILKNNKKCFIRKIAYDSYNATQWAIDATGEGLPLQPFGQGLWHFNQCTKEFERLIRQGKIVIDNNEITRWCFKNVMLKQDHNENVKPVKSGGQKSGQQKIDGVIAMLQALGTYLEENHGDLTIV